ncbi:UbiA-like protein EboC [Fulvivirgaceae bacterium PWU5]|uniref:UbiA-like protein EboC n=1 Tax=Dawidia cretensis TaxID=2782350 RepID=A0AAP2E282_9BACT|nr:UbiA-like protein EboC [Dawidia cretensis]MBT1710673.1 UbiA-like protein EboC [Dawidia cretensis]
MKKLIGYLRLMRPANIVTAVSDILAGAAIAGFAVVGEQPSSSQYLYWLVLSTVGLYGGGVVFNDVFDAALDRVERPERPIPSGLISGTEAALLGSILLLAGIAAAFMFSPLSGAIAMAIAVAALVYDKWGKHHSFLGPVNMGLCRGLDLLLGMSLVPEVIAQFGFLAVAPILYIAAITMISRGEVHGGKSNTMLAAGGLYGVVILAIVTWSIANHAYYALVFLVLLIILIFPPLVRAYRAPIGPNIGKAVKAGVLALIIMNAAWAAATGAILLAIIIALLLPVSIAMAKLFAVT